MKTTIRVSQVLHEGAVTGRHGGRVLREQVVAVLAGGACVEMDFSGVDNTTQSAADEFIGRIIRQRPDLTNRISFSNCSREVAGMLQWTAEHANSAFQAGDGMVAA
ncbi:MAG: STAS-like domain-containing protein [Verrucomicrobia bacterium]|nr:STAS-like domain-containing protein [Verrucomicrobiota bacterium]